MEIKVVNSIPQEDINKIINMIVNNDWQRFELIGMGSESCVYKYKKYAIKHASDLNDPKILECFQDNPIFPKLYFYGEDFMVTEYFEIINAYEYFERNVDIFMDAFEIYEYCYSKGYIPYDIHDENVVVTNNDELKIIDVGSFSKSIYPEHYTIHNILVTDKNLRSDYTELDNIINHVKRPPIAI